ncbi:hypothetical protein B0H11DRAFT_2244798 [Mycena galericulata]|nr:hypothetical protein B0H11DRAFT_2244798 [Mycena galericulata]
MGSIGSKSERERGGYGSGRLRTPGVDPFAGDVPASLGVPAAELGAGAGGAARGQTVKAALPGRWRGTLTRRCPCPRTGTPMDTFIDNNAIEEVPPSRVRRVWLAVVWRLTFYLPSFMLSFVGGMKRPDNTDSNDYWVAIQGLCLTLCSGTTAISRRSRATASLSSMRSRGRILRLIPPDGALTLFTDPSWQLAIQNFTDTEPTEIHSSDDERAALSRAERRLVQGDVPAQDEELLQGAACYTTCTPQAFAADTNIAKSGSRRSAPTGQSQQRDSRILLYYLNRVHFDGNPLEPEIYHQMRNVIGIDPVFYEYIFTIDGLQLFPTRLSFLVHGRDWLGNTEGKEKKVIITEDEKFDNSMIPRKKFSQYEAEALETASRHSEDVGYSGKSRSRSRGPLSRGKSPHP